MGENEYSFLHYVAEQLSILLVSKRFLNDHSDLLSIFSMSNGVRCERDQVPVLQRCSV